MTLGFLLSALRCHALDAPVKRQGSKQTTRSSLAFFCFLHATQKSSTKNTISCKRKIPFFLSRMSVSMLLFQIMNPFSDYRILQPGRIIRENVRTKTVGFFCLSHCISYWVDSFSQSREDLYTLLGTLTPLTIICREGAATTASIHSQVIKRLQNKVGFVVFSRSMNVAVVISRELSRY